MKDLKSILGEKKALDPVEKEAKLAAIKGMRKMAGDMMADDLKSMKKVTVAAPDDASLQEGLNKAEEMVGEEAPTEMSEEAGESEDYEGHDVDAILEKCDTPEEIDELMAKLAEKKAALVQE